MTSNYGGNNDDNDNYQTVSCLKKPVEDTLKTISSNSGNNQQRGLHRINRRIDYEAVDRSSNNHHTSRIIEVNNRNNMVPLIMLTGGGGGTDKSVNKEGDERVVSDGIRSEQQRESRSTPQNNNHKRTTSV